MARKFITPANNNPTPNVCLGSSAQGYYDKLAKKAKMLTISPGSLLTNDHDKNSWIYVELESLSSQGYLDKKEDGYIVLKPLCGSPSGMAAAVLGRSASSRVSGYTQWTFSDGRNIHEANERP